MILTCPQCQTEYKLSPEKLGYHGCTVRCTECSHTWFQRHVPEQHIEEVIADAAPERVEEEEADLMADLVQDIAPEDIPDSIRPLATGFTVRPVVYRPMGMGPLQFGFFTFLLCAFVSLSALFLLRVPVVHALPQTSLLYKKMGFHVPAPGEGLRFDALEAEQRFMDDGRSLVLKVKLSNIADRAIDRPALHVFLKRPYGAVMKDWKIENKERRELAPGESIPVELEFNDVPEGASDVEIRVVKE